MWFSIVQVMKNNFMVGSVVEPVRFWPAPAPGIFFQRLRLWLRLHNTELVPVGMRYFDKNGYILHYLLFTGFILGSEFFLREFFAELRSRSRWSRNYLGTWSRMLKIN